MLILVKDHSITEQQYEQALAAKQSADRQLQVLIDQKKSDCTANEYCIFSNSCKLSTNQCCRIVAKQREVDVENAKLNFLYSNPSSGRRICWKSANSGRTVFTGWFTVVCFG
jgi:membrane fusion protein (multidrug efflux system)